MARPNIRDFQGQSNQALAECASDGNQRATTFCAKERYYTHIADYDTLQPGSYKPHKEGVFCCPISQ